MSQTVCVIVNPEDVARLEAIVADRNRALKHIQRARIVLTSSERLTVQEVARRTGASRRAVWRWQARFAEQGVDGLVRDKTRPGISINLLGSAFRTQLPYAACSRARFSCSANASPTVRRGGIKSRTRR